MFMKWMQFEVKYILLILGVGLGDSNGYNWIVLYSGNAVSRRTSLLCSSWYLESLKVSLGASWDTIGGCVSFSPPTQYLPWSNANDINVVGDRPPLLA